MTVLTRSRRSPLRLIIGLVTCGLVVFGRKGVGQVLVGLEELPENFEVLKFLIRLPSVFGIGMSFPLHEILVSLGRPVLLGFEDALGNISSFSRDEGWS
jgi:hypothetical protein